MKQELFRPPVVTVPCEWKTTSAGFRARGGDGSAPARHPLCKPATFCKRHKTGEPPNHSFPASVRSESSSIRRISRQTEEERPKPLNRDHILKPLSTGCHSRSSGRSNRHRPERTGGLLFHSAVGKTERGEREAWVRDGGIRRVGISGGSHTQVLLLET